MTCYIRFGLALIYTDVYLFVILGIFESQQNFNLGKGPIIFLRVQISIS